MFFRDREIPFSDGDCSKKYNLVFKPLLCISITYTQYDEGPPPGPVGLRNRWAPSKHSGESSLSPKDAVGPEHKGTGLRRWRSGCLPTQFRGEVSITSPPPSRRGMGGAAHLSVGGGSLGPGPRSSETRMLHPSGGAHRRMSAADAGADRRPKQKSPACILCLCCGG